jgi:hypothetical protein
MLWLFAQFFLSPQVTMGCDPVPIFKGAFGISHFGDSEMKWKEETLYSLEVPVAENGLIVHHVSHWMDDVDHFSNVGPPLAWTLSAFWVAGF